MVTSKCIRETWSRLQVPFNSCKTRRSKLFTTERETGPVGLCLSCQKNSHISVKISLKPQLVKEITGMARFLTPGRFPHGGRYTAYSIGPKIGIDFRKA
ncbi:hypothetical protein H4W29_003243 [Rhizobium viscosum]|uniref:Uncharacterized protein n=1 Tax=Rhizobium viscosum TaxID=1673 RepID=A0ABR9IT74_RHIVS|nr:hypothetical protein [Rhizobium viscosum]